MSGRTRQATLDDLGMPAGYQRVLAGWGVRSIGAFVALPEHGVAHVAEIGAALVHYHRVARAEYDAHGVPLPVEADTEAPDNIIDFAAVRARARYCVASSTMAR